MKIIIPGRPVPAVRMTQGEVKWAKAALKGRWPETKSMFEKVQVIHRYWNYKEIVAWIARAAGVKLLTKARMSAQAYICGGAIGDWDNYGKGICDALKGIAWKDDNGRIVVGGSVEVIQVKTKAEERMEVEIWEV